MQSHLARRRFIQIVAASAAAAAMPLPHLMAAEKPTYRWNGVALGAAASMQFHGKSAAESKALCKLCLDEVLRLERILSLYEPHSAINQLNAEGELKNAPPELTELLAFSKKMGDVTQGMFDVTVQPVWRALKEGKAAHDVKAKRDLVNYQHIAIEGNDIAFKNKGMQVTLNGVAQGYITDKVTALLKRHGVEHVLVNMGEFSALGKNAQQQSWKVGLRDADNLNVPIKAIALEDGMALATSAGYGTKLGSEHHLLNPKTLRASHYYKSLSILAPSAAMADALSTGLYHLPKQQAEKVVTSLNQHAALGKDIQFFTQV